MRLDAALVAPEIDVQAGAESKALALADFGDPKGPLLSDGGRAAFGHQQDLAAIGVALLLVGGLFDLGVGGMGCWAHGWWWRMRADRKSVV